MNLQWPSTSSEWAEFLSKETDAPRWAEDVLKEAIGLWHRAQAEDASDEIHEKLDTLLEDAAPTIALCVLGENPTPAALDLLLRVQESPLGLEDEIFGDFLSDAWEPLMLTLCREPADVDKLAALACRRDRSEVGRMTATTGLSTLALKANGHPLERTAAARLERLVEELAAACDSPDADDDDAEVASDALSSATMVLAPHPPTRRARYLELYDHPFAVHIGGLGAREHFVKDVDASEPFFRRSENWPFRARDLIARWYGSDEDILGERRRAAEELRAFLAREIARGEKRKSKRKAQKAARKKSKR